MVDNAIILVIPELLQLVLKGDKVVGFVLPFRDVSAAFKEQWQVRTNRNLAHSAGNQ